MGYVYKGRGGTYVTLEVLLQGGRHGQLEVEDPRKREGQREDDVRHHLQREHSHCHKELHDPHLQPHGTGKPQGFRAPSTRVQGIPRFGGHWTAVSFR